MLLLTSNRWAIRGPLKPSCQSLRHLFCVGLSCWHGESICTSVNLGQCFYPLNHNGIDAQANATIAPTNSASPTIRFALSRRR